MSSASSEMGLISTLWTAHGQGRETQCGRRKGAVQKPRIVMACEELVLARLPEHSLTDRQADESMASGGESSILGSQ